MLDTVWKRWVFAVALAVVLALGITALLSRPPRDTKQQKADAIAAWKAATGIDLAALPKQVPPTPDSDSARGLDAVLQPADLHLGSRPTRRPQEHRDDQALGALRDALRAEMRFESLEVKPFPAPVIALIERLAPVLDAVATYVEGHQDIRWYEDFGPRTRESTLWTEDHLSLHRLLIARAYLALERDDVETAKRMLVTSKRLNQVLIARHERISQFIAAGIERLQLALLRRGGDRLDSEVEEPLHRLRERYLVAMSSEAALVLANSGRDPFHEGAGPGEVAVHIFARENIELAAVDAVIAVSRGVAEIIAAEDPCAELKKDRRLPDGFFAGDSYRLHPNSTWQRFVLLALDRAMTSAVISGRAESPCRSVVIAVREDGRTRTVEVAGMPEASEYVIGVAEKMTVQLNQKPPSS